MSDLRELRSLVANMRRALVVSHISPDGDTIGSALALARALRQRGVVVRLSCADPVPAELRFLPGSVEFAATHWSDEDAIVVVDTSDTERLGSIHDADAFARVLVVNIDHHVTNVGYGDINLVSQKASTAELVAELLEFWGIALDPEIATCLLTGLVTDTQGFRTGNTTADTFGAAQRLVAAGASLSKVMDAAFNHRSLGAMRLWAAALWQAKLEDGLMWLEVTQSLLKSIGVGPEACKGLVNFASTVHEAKVVIVFREQDDGTVDVSFRSTAAHDVSRIALSLGGGGHPQAAGCLVPGPFGEARELVLRLVRRSLADGSLDRTIPFPMADR